jgi:polysaccharide biosynthesis protein PslG
MRAISAFLPLIGGKRMFAKILQHRRYIALALFTAVCCGTITPVQANLNNAFKASHLKINSIREKSRVSTKPKSKKVRKKITAPKKVKRTFRSSKSLLTSRIKVSEAFGLNYAYPDPWPQPGEMEMLASTGVRWIRIDFLWSAIESQKGKYDFTYYDRVFELLAQYNLRPVVILAYGNQHYQGATPSAWPYSVETPEAQQAFTDWAMTAVQRYQGRGFIWEMWNEPDHTHFWPPQPNVQLYSQLALKVGKAIKQQAPDETFVGPALVSQNYSYLEETFKTGLLNYWDGVSVHPYRSKSPEWASSDYAQYKSLIRKYNTSKTIPVLSTEWGYPSTPWEGLALNEQMQARFLARQWLVNLLNNVPISIWMDWRESPNSSNTLSSGTWGLVRHQYYPGRNPAYDAKPAYFAAKTLTTTLRDYSFSRRLGVGSSVDYALEFDNVVQTSSNKAYAVWRDHSKSTTLNLPITSGKFSVVSHLGANLGTLSAGATGLKITVSSDPRYLVPIK